MRPLLETRQISRFFGGVRAIDALDLQIAKGETLGLIGPNGAGKTTLFNLLTGTDPPDAGTIWLSGQNITQWTPWRRAQAGLIRTFQHGRTFANLSAMDNVLVGAHRRNRPPGLWGALFPWGWQQRQDRDLRHEMMKILQTFGDRLAPRADQPAYTFSYANRRRIELARALAAQPRILLLDEPTAGMNPAETGEILEFLQGRKAQGQTMIIIEHKLPLILPLADRMIVLDHGTKLAEGTPSEIPQNPKVIEAYLGKPSGGADGH